MQKTTNLLKIFLQEQVRDRRTDRQMANGVQCLTQPFRAGFIKLNTVIGSQRNFYCVFNNVCEGRMVYIVTDKCQQY